MLIANKDSCVGMVANMIGVRKRIIAFLDESGRAPTYTVMLNPEIIKKDGAYNTEEGCLSLLGVLRLANAINPSGSSIRPWNCRTALRPTPAGQHRLFSMRLITVMEY